MKRHSFNKTNTDLISLISAKRVEFMNEIVKLYE